MPALEGIAIDGMPAIAIFPWRLSDVVRRGAVTGMPGRRGFTVTVWNRREGETGRGKRDDGRRRGGRGRDTHTCAFKCTRVMYTYFHIVYIHLLSLSTNRHLLAIGVLETPTALMALQGHEHAASAAKEEGKG